ncbi:MAG: hypothetical protein A2921_00170 [Candidatus Magasanikbacteria bacterium RIFCSPLOWO2_01_FULL_43_20b]|uniref:Uncharacterized protein n=1 Tax=Candidatus Magasanikbacteria bacterium RIFCSPLOWO2_12_FULL_43_12 TaxID=1798692 RepID=A0A1F6MRZ7_9BACT|nr:MAG: hypothetical protein A3C74_03330 [Candidatus Magasanikbacteria bacterium RIFCSPHIGHO2_02_FULL_44_13]OGH72299.1 MAG: hypothetical protein A3I93_02415 [Candidatus Magasanikbacteria bacterium RIFCSPLOWO2_02_FULL_43_22]OGH73373.1 MAG: hypothetical protein A2921_00170 [Candidatus Magasanikbacteria bacterium RIFCSPLOWO2_01_FULL_43_20b]OGH74203.1 MAG: hypothetical protein A3G00_02245 [Candidatus Magasanikbacteria bacterium RIFCSPLOWO2_12_FULL_43_12]
MKLSALQQFILLRCLEDGGKIERSDFRGFYCKPADKRKTALKKYQEGAITKSLERLIDKELMIGYGRRTPHKWFITHVRLTKKGQKIGQWLLEERQIKLPFE